MIEDVRYDESVAHFLRMHPDADEARAVIDGLTRDKLPAVAMTDIDDLGTGYALMPETDRCIWWHYEVLVWFAVAGGLHALLGS